MKDQQGPVQGAYRRLQGLFGDVVEKLLPDAERSAADPYIRLPLLFDRGLSLSQEMLQMGRI
jgi:hypothetical protein